METEAVLERVWEPHDEVGDAIHAVSRANFLPSVEGPRGGRRQETGGGDEDAGARAPGFVFVEDFIREDEYDAAMKDARSLGAIRFALENLEDQIQFFYAVQLQLQTERNAAIARLEQSRANLAMRLADLSRKFKDTDEAFGLVCDVFTPEILDESEVTKSQSDKNLKDQEVTGPSMSLQMLTSNFAIAAKSFRLMRIHGVLRNVAQWTVCMLAFLKLNQLIFKGESAGQARGKCSVGREPEGILFGWIIPSTAVLQ